MKTLALVRASVRLDGHSVVNPIDLTLDAGTWLAIVGPNGAGKSTLLRAIAGLLAHDGTITVMGQRVNALRPFERARLVAYMPQRPVAAQDMTVAQYVLLGRTPHLRAFGRTTTEDLELTRSTLRRLELEALQDRTLATLSGGEQQRAHLAQVLAQRAPVVLLDEPTTSLDIGHGQRVLDLLDEMRHELGLTVVTTLHDLNHAGMYADQVALLSRGELVTCGAPADVLTASAIHDHYGAVVEIAVTKGRVAVIPQRSTVD